MSIYMMKQTLFTTILLLLTIVIVKSQRNLFLIPRHISIKLPDIEIIDLPYEYNEYEKDKNASYGWWDNRQKFHFY